MIVYRCEDSLEGIFTAIYNAYAEKRNHCDTIISLTDEFYLFAEDVSVQADSEKAIKVMRTLERQFGEEDYLWLCYALTSPDEGKAQAVYQTVVDGLSRRVPRGHLFDNLAYDAVNRSFALGRGANRESLHLKGFVRFQELENGILYSKIGPKNNILTFLMPHFADRFPLENFMIYDENRRLLGLHPAGKQWYVMSDCEDPGQSKAFRLSESEWTYQELFRFFCDKIAIEDRKNPDLQRNMLPLRFRDYMVEFQ
uniref:TIGR03915 family putative DNA repair protein n=1 Tax=Acetatifactor sp. TaxID=1872090 RepID=UPI004055D83D